MKQTRTTAVLLWAAAGLAAPAAAQQTPPAPDSARAVSASSPQAPVAIPGVEAVARKSSRMIGDFYQRASRGGGRYVTRADIDRRHPRTTTDLFRGVPSVEVVGGSVRFRSSEGHVPTGTSAIPRGMGDEGGSGQAGGQQRGRSGDGGQAAGMALRGGDSNDSSQLSDCVPAVYVDGTRWDAGAADLSSLRPDEIEGIEIYARPGTAPAQYRRLNQDCAIVLVWMRERQL